MGKSLCLTISELFSNFWKKFGREVELDELKGSIKGSFSKSPLSTELFTHGEGWIMKVEMTGSSTMMGRLVGDEGL